MFIHSVSEYVERNGRLLRLYTVVVERKRVVDCILAKYPGLRVRRHKHHGERIDVCGSTQQSIDMALAEVLRRKLYAKELSGI